MAAIYVPEEFYVGMRGAVDTNPMGFMTPTMKEGLVKRKETVDKWAGTANAVHNMTIKNDPMTGFIVQHKQRRYSTSNVVWDVLHPLGFKFQISSENFEDLFKDSKINKGEIKRELFFLRTGNSNYLTYKGSDIEKKAVSQTDAEGKVSLRDISIGDEVLLRSGVQGIYMGAVHVLGIPRIYNSYLSEIPETNLNNKSIRRHVFKTQKTYQPYITYSSPTITSIVKKAKKPGTIEETIAELKGTIVDGGDHKTRFIPGHFTVMGIDSKPMNLGQMKIELIPLAENRKAHYLDGISVVAQRSDTEGLVIHHTDQRFNGSHEPTIRIADDYSVSIDMPAGGKLYSPAYVIQQYTHRGYGMSYGTRYSVDKLVTTEDHSVITQTFLQWAVRP